MRTAKRLLRRVVAILLGVALVFSLYVVLVTVGHPVGPVGTVAVWGAAAVLAWATTRAWTRNSRRA